MDNEDLRNLNDIGGRIRWTRECLGLSKRKVSIDTTIPRSAYFGREQGVRTYYIEEYKVLAEYFNEKWKIKYKLNFPMFQKIEIKRITPMWLMFGER